MRRKIPGTTGVLPRELTSTTGFARRKALSKLFHSCFTFAQPMVGNQVFSEICNRALDGRLLCHTFNRDVVPHLPPNGLKTSFAHAGTHFYAEARGDDDPSTPEFRWCVAPGEQAPTPAASPLVLLEAGFALFTGRSDLLAGLSKEIARYVDTLRDLLQGVERARKEPLETLADSVVGLGAAVVREGAHTVGSVLSFLSPGPQGAPAPPAPPPWNPGGYTFADHMPSHYVAASQPNGKLTEFGDDF